jgi:hypothetical protein
MACESTIFALHTSSFEEELLTESTKNDSVELSLNEFMSILLMDFFFAFANGTLTT